MIRNRIPYATIAFAVLFIAFYYFEPSSQLCFDLPCSVGTHQDWVTQNIAFLGTFVHTSNYHLYGNLLSLASLGVPLEAFIVPTNMKVRYGVFLCSLLISVCLTALLFYSAVDNFARTTFGASVMTSAMIPFVLSSLLWFHAELKGVGRWVPVSIGIGTANILYWAMSDLSVRLLSNTNLLHLFGFFSAIGVLLSIRKIVMKSKPAPKAV